MGPGDRPKERRSSGFLARHGGEPSAAAPPPGSSGRLSAKRSYWASPLALAPLLLLGVIVAVLLLASEGRNFGLSFWGPVWDFLPTDPAGSTYGIALFAVGTAITAGAALLLASGLSLAIAIALTVYLPPRPSRILTMLTDLLAGIPSVVYGIWGFVILAPYFASTLEPNLRNAIGWLPGFGGPESAIGGGTGLLLGIFLLTLMVVPLTTAVMRESLRSVPREVVEAGLALGATPWEVVRRVRIKSAGRGLWGAVFLGFGRAVGESVALAMVLGNTIQYPPSIYAGSYTIASFIFTQLDSAFLYPDLLRALVEFALVLLLITVAFNLLGQRAVAGVRSRTVPGAGGRA
jgi:phosphate transport system permease protein